MNGFKSNQNSCRFRFLICFGFWPSHQVDLSRLDQQSWKRELEEEAKAKKAEGGNGGDESDPPKRKGKKPGRPKAKATAKRAAKSKPKISLVVNRVKFLPKFPSVGLQRQRSPSV